MFTYLFGIIKSNNPNLVIFKISIILAIILVGMYLYRISSPNIESNKSEGFTQNAPFILKENQNVYDEFYAEVYNGLHDTVNFSQKALMQIIKMTEPTNQSVFLDIGSGTGQLVNELTNAGYHAYGIDKSQAMNDYAEKMHPEIETTCGDIVDPMTFEKSTFSHVLCTDKTVYLFEDKLTFFRNSYFWLMPNGYLIIHLVDPDKFEMIQPKGNATRLVTQTNARKLDTMADFYDFNYAASYRFPTHVNKTNTKIVLKETFTDSKTNHVRQNEQTLYMNPINDILDMASKAGFIFHSKVNMKEINGDVHQYLYVFERPM